MRHHRHLLPNIVIALLALLAGSVMLQAVVFGQGGQPPAAAQEVVSPGAVTARPAPAITYQGNLKRGGAPYTGVCDFRFTLWDAASNGGQIGLTNDKAGIEVHAGLFTVVLVFGFENNFIVGGQNRFIQTQVKCPGDAGYTTLNPRQALYPVPSALTLQPGAIIKDSSISTGVDSIYVEQSTTNSNAIHGKGTAPGSIGVWGEGVNNTGVYGLSQGGRGVWGRSASEAGVYGESTSWAGVWGQSTGASGVVGISSGQYNGGVYGENTGLGRGVYGKSPNGTGVLGESREWKGVVGISTNQTGVYGESATFDGVSGLAKGVGKAGVIGRATGARGVGVWGIGGPNGYAGKFDGPVRSTILEIAGGADLAERFETSGSEPIAPGTLMVIDASHPGHLMPSDQAYDTRVAGIVSGAGGVQPGLTLQQEGVLEGDTAVAIAGRVYVLAEADSAPIQPGDLLTTSDLPGHAMKAGDRTRSYGAVVGKAMTGLEHGTGLVLVLVNLQ